MRRLAFILLLITAASQATAQSEFVEGVDYEFDYDFPIQLEGIGSAADFTVYRSRKPIMYLGEPMFVYYLPEISVYPPINFKSAKEREKYNKLVYNVKKTLPIARKIRTIIEETVMAMDGMSEQDKKEHIKAIEKELRKTYEPELKKLTYSQGKLLIKLVDRECNQSSYEIVRAFFGPAKAGFYQVFAWTFNASLKKEYLPDSDDRLVERAVRMVERGLE